MRTAAWRSWAVAMAALATFAAAPASSAQVTTTTPAATRAWLGVYTQELTTELREGMTYKGQGVLVSRVVSGSPAERAGVKSGDVITAFNAKTVDSPDALSSLVGQAKAGQQASIRIVRDGKTQNLTAKLEARSEDKDDADEWMGHMGDDGDREIHIRGMGPGDMNFDFPGLMVSGMARGRLGVRVESLNPDLGGYFSVPDGKGVLVVEVMKDTPAEKAGLKAGDVITKVGDKPVFDAHDLSSALGPDGGKVSLGIVRKGAKRTVEAQIEKDERVIRIRHGNGAMGWGEGGRPSQKDFDDLRRQVEDLRRQLEKLQHD